MKRSMAVATALGCLAMAGCATTRPKPPPNAGELIVQAIHTWGPIDANGITLPAHYYDGKPIGHGPLACGAGRPSARVDVLAHRTAHAKIDCSDP